MSNVISSKSTEDCKVADLRLAEFGRKEIEIAAVFEKADRLSVHLSGLSTTHLEYRRRSHRNAQSQKSSRHVVEYGDNPRNVWRGIASRGGRCFLFLFHSTYF